MSGPPTQATETSTEASVGTAADGDGGAADHSVVLNAEEQALLLAELDVVLPSLDEQRAARLAPLRADVAEGVVSAPNDAALASLLELTLQIGRARARYRADGEATLTSVYRRTRAGKALSAHLRDVNKALASLEGQTVDALSVRMRTVGHFTLTVQTDGASLTLVARPDTIDVEAITVGS